MFSSEDLIGIKKRHQLLDIAEEKGFKLKNELRNVRYEEELKLLQAELVNLQQWITKKKMRVALIFEGRDISKNFPIQERSFFLTEVGTIGQ
jgi:polyphosphate kinase